MSGTGDIFLILHKATHEELYLMWSVFGLAGPRVTFISGSKNSWWVNILNLKPSQSWQVLSGPEKLYHPPPTSHLTPHTSHLTPITRTWSALQVGGHLLTKPQGRVLCFIFIPPIRRKPSSVTYFWWYDDMKTLSVSKIMTSFRITWKYPVSRVSRSSDKIVFCLVVRMLGSMDVWRLNPGQTPDWYKGGRVCVVNLLLNNYTSFTPL